MNLAPLAYGDPNGNSDIMGIRRSRRENKDDTWVIHMWVDTLIVWGEYPIVGLGRRVRFEWVYATVPIPIGPVLWNNQ